MRIEFRTNVLGAQKPLGERARIRLEAALDRFRDRLSHVRMRLLDENGEKGGLDKRCFVQVVGRRGTTALVTCRGFDAEGLIDSAADRVGHRVSRLFERERETRRGDSFDGRRDEHRRARGERDVENGPHDGG